MNKDGIQIRLRTVFLILTIAASCFALFALQPTPGHTAFRLESEGVQLEQALHNRLLRSPLDISPELDRAEQLVFALGGLNGEPMYYEFEESQLVDSHPEYVTWDPEIQFVLDAGSIKWMNITTDEILDIREVAKRLIKKPPAWCSILALATLIISIFMLIRRSDVLILLFVLLLFFLILTVVGSPA